MSDPQFASLTADDLVTGEAVALDLPPASVGARLSSGLLDVAVLVTFAVVVLFVAYVATSHADGALRHVAMVGSLILVLLVYPTTMETLTHGKSVGKLALGLRVVRDDGGTVTVQHSFVRALIGIVEIYALLGAPAFFCCMLSTRGKRIGDYGAGTYVVRDRASLTLAPPPRMPIALASWAASTDLGTPPVGLVLAVRQYLARLSTLDPATRERLGTMLATRMSTYVAPPPPAGTPPWDYLAAVSAARRERDQARLRRDEAFRDALTSRSR